MSFVISIYFDSYIKEVSQTCYFRLKNDDTAHVKTPL